MFTSAFSFNVDVDHPVVLRGPRLTKNRHFGYRLEFGKDQVFIHEMKWLKVIFIEGWGALAVHWRPSK